MVMNPTTEVIPELLRYNLEPEIYSVEFLKAYYQLIYLQGGCDQGRYKIHLKIDTGMNRMGIKPDEIDSILVLIKEYTCIEVASVFSHLSASDNPEFDPFTRNQITIFTEVSDRIESVLGYSFIRHIANTGGIERFPDAQFDMVRLGIGLYGVGVKADNQSQLQVASSLYAPVIMVKEVTAGEVIGYNCNYITDRDYSIAIISIGYADGVQRRLGNGVGHVFISGERRPIVGSVCMDLIMVDITGLPTVVNEYVEIFGSHMSPKDMAKDADTIAHEILTGISPRVERVYLENV